MVSPLSQTTGRGSLPARRVLVILALILGPPVLVLYVALIHRPAQRAAKLDHLLQIDAEWDCCNSPLTQLNADCRSALGDLISLKDQSTQAHPAGPAWLPARFRELGADLRQDPSLRRAASFYQRCPSAQELEEPTSAAGDRLCGVVATQGEREDLAREAAHRGTLGRSLLEGACTVTGYDAGLQRIQVDFDRVCGEGACLDVLLNAPAASRPRVQAIVAAHADAVTRALEPLLTSSPSARAVDLLTLLLGPDGQPVAGLVRGDVSEVALSNVLDLLQQPLARRTVAVLSLVRSRADGPASAVAALVLDEAGIIRATDTELAQGLQALQKHGCGLVERALILIDLGYGDRADAALPVLIACPAGARAILGDRFRLALTRSVLEAALQGRFGDVDELLIDRLDDGSDANLQLLDVLAEQRELAPAAQRLIRTLEQVFEARHRRIEGSVQTEGEGR